LPPWDPLLPGVFCAGIGIAAGARPKTPVEAAAAPEAQVAPADSHSPLYDFTALRHRLSSATQTHHADSNGRDDVSNNDGDRNHDCVGNQLQSQRGIHDAGAVIHIDWRSSGLGW
jgi:hypothetical protein